MKKSWEELQKNYKEFVPKIVGYSTILNGEENDFPYIESIKSMLGFCDEVVVVDGGSTDGTLEKLNQLSKENSKLKISVRNWDWDEPGMDGAQKAYARAICEVGPNDFLWQQDMDELVHEDDYNKIKNLVKKFPKNFSLMHLPVIELWGKENQVRTDRHSWKWRLSRNDWKITHGINKYAKLTDEKTGKVYAKKGMSDGCEFVDIMTGEFIPHNGFYNNELEQLRKTDPVQYGNKMNELFNSLPSVYHFSWFDLERKIRNFKSFWNRQWASLYLETPTDRFPNVHTEEDIVNKAKEMEHQGGEHGLSVTFTLCRSMPKLIEQWITKVK